MDDHTIRTLTLGALIAFCVFFGLITISAAIESKFTFLTAISIGILAMFISGLIGALRNPPDE